MKAFALKLIFFSLLCSFACEAVAQVRVRHGRRAVNPKPRRKAKTVEAVAQVKKKEYREAAIRPSKKRPARNDMDAMFYVAWHGDEGLNYADFQYNKNLYNKFLPAKDTDLAAVIYPDYRDFYQKLNDRLKTAGGADDDFWQEKIEHILTERKDFYNTGSIPDSNFSFAISIDSPAASVINILPVIYAVNETTYYFNITVLFSKYDSWMIVKSKDILEHEQIHFDIFELFARKMRRHLAETLKKNATYESPTDLTNEIAPAYEQFYQQLNDMQLEFDKQTAKLTAANASLLGTNLRWKKFLANQIDLLREYATAEGTIVLK